MQLRESKAVWKVIAADMPIGLQVGDGLDSAGRPQWENLANGGGPVLGREFEIANILSYIKRSRIANVVWITADAHYCAAHYYSPEKAQFKDFNPFWEFVAGPLNAGSFGPNALDNTFGPEVIFQSFPPAANFSPFAGLQFFGQDKRDHGEGTPRQDDAKDERRLSRRPGENGRGTPSRAVAEAVTSSTRILSETAALSLAAKEERFLTRSFFCWSGSDESDESSDEGHPLAGRSSRHRPSPRRRISFSSPIVSTRQRLIV
jgi:hypothetical protein